MERNKCSKKSTKERNRFLDFYDTLDINEYEASEIVHKYNDFFNSDNNISNIGFGMLKEVKDLFS